MSIAAITVLGLGPGGIDDLTVEAWQLLTRATADKEHIYFRTTIHPMVEPLRQRLPGIQIASFDHLYDESQAWDVLYQRIAEEVCQLAEQHPGRGIIYAVPGHPLVGESSVQLVLKMARERALRVKIVSGLSFLEPVCNVLELDPFAAGLHIMEATSLASLHGDQVGGKIVPTVPLIVTQVYNRRLASEVKLALGECYPDEWPVKLVRAAGSEAEQVVIELPLYELDRANRTDHLSTLYVPPLDELTSLRLPETFRYVIMRLRRDPDGCPWDRQQTHQSLVRYLIEETYEVVEALEENDMDKLADELGDVLLQVYLHAEIARQNDEFTLGDVFEHVSAKMIRRHPHIFADVQVDGAGQVLQNWEAIKRQERIEAGREHERSSALDGIPPGLPALSIAQEYQKRAAKVGFDYTDRARVLAKLEEELKELHEANTAEEQLEELGDVLYIAARLARAYGVDAEASLRQANRKFRRRFELMERFQREEGRAYASYSSEEWGALWRRAKIQEKDELSEQYASVETVEIPDDDV